MPIMKRLAECSCGDRHLLHFENTRCVRCEAPVAYLPDQGILSNMLSAGDGLWKSPHSSSLYRACDNRRNPPACNWMIPAEWTGNFCVACHLNEVVPDLKVAGNDLRWTKLEAAKRRLISLLLDLGLPVVAKSVDPENGLAFRFLADTSEPVLTGHASGVVTINIGEADDDQREAERVRLGEMHRTLLGHFRHETGHYYWERLVRDAGLQDDFRALFGDERADYAEALEKHYQEGPQPGWQDRFISAYASAHPFEDWAETWMHYLLMRDALSTCRDLLDIPDPVLTTRLETSSFPDLLAAWHRLALCVNALSRSVGTGDVYPFVVNQVVSEKLSWIHQRIRDSVGVATAVSRF